MIEEVKQDIKYSSYTQAQKKASQIYRQKNKDKINEQRKKYYQAKKESDPKFLEYKRIKAKEYYEKKKLDKVVRPDVILEETKVEEPVVEPEKPVEVLPELLKEAIVTPLPESTPEPKKKSKKSKK
jgi:hypothetical protein